MEPEGSSFRDNRINLAGLQHLIQSLGQNIFKEVMEMKTIPPTIREKVLQAWQQGTRSEHQLAEQFNLGRELITEIISEGRAARALPINRQVLSMAQELYSVMPTEVAGSFARKFEGITGIRSGLLAVPSM